MKYKAEETDGKWTIKDVPFFKVGKHKGFEYSEDWCDDAINKANNLEQDNYKSSVFIGHNDGGSDEKPVVGYMSNLKRVGDTIYTSISDISSESLDTFKKALYPYRSAETSPSGGFFSGLALLGSRRPYFKFPPLNLAFNQFGDDLAVEDVLIHIDKDDSAISVEQLDSLIHDYNNRLSDNENIINEAVSQLSTKEPIDQGVELMSDITAEQFNELNSKFSDQSDQLKKAFETIEAFSASVETLQKSNEELTKNLEQAENDRAVAEKQAIVKEAETFAEQLKQGRVSYVPEGHGVSPAVVDSARMSELSELQDTHITFADGDSEKSESVSKVMSVFAEAVIKAAAKNELFVDLTEHAQSNDVADETKINPESRVSGAQADRDAQIRTFMVKSLGGEEQYNEAKGDWATFSHARQHAMKELDLNDDYDEAPN